MKRDYSFSGLKVGIVVTVGLVILVALVFTIGQRGGMFASYYELRATFPKVNGLVIGSPVWLAGVEVGYVDEIRFPTNLKSKELTVVMKIRKKYQQYIRSDSKAFIETKGLLGNKIITIYLGSPKGRILHNDDLIPSVPPLDITEFVSGATASLRNLENIIKDLRDIGNAIREGKGSLGLLVNDTQLYNQLVSILSELKRFSGLLNRTNSSLGKVLTSSELYDNVNDLIVEARTGKGTLPLLLQNRQPFDKINEILARLDKIVAYIESGKGDVGKIVKEEQLYKELLNTLKDTRMTLDQVKVLIEDIKKNPQKYFRVKVF